MARDRDKWRAVINAVMDIRIPQNAGNFSDCGRIMFSRRTALQVSQFVC